MKVYFGFDELPKFLSPTVTIGSFDGVHRGHMAILQRVIEESEKVGGESVVLTFETHPRIILNQGVQVGLLTSLKEKICLLEQLGIDNLIVISFDLELSQMSPTDFILKYLVGKIGAKSFVVGYNNHFGKDQEGGYSFFEQNNFGFEVIEVPKITIDEIPNLSSTSIRGLVAAGEMMQVELMLSHPYIVCGKNVDGVIYIEDKYKLLPPCGEYEVTIEGKIYAVLLEVDRVLIVDNIAPYGDVIIKF